MSRDNLERIHEVDFTMMDEVVKIFDRYNLNYFLIAGTLLGAVRHHGFIPWDDDLDIGVPRESYEKFLENYANELPDRYKVQNFKSSKGSKYYVTRILDTKIQVRELRDDSSLTYASIDLFPMDGTPNNKLFRKIHICRILFWRMMASFSQSSNIDPARKRNTVEKVLVWLAKTLPLDKVLNTQHIYYRIDKILKKYNIQNSQYVGSLMGAYREKELFRSDYIKNFVPLQFEEKKFLCPEKYDLYLKHMYGDYMVIPDQSAIKSKRHFDLIIQEEQSRND